MINKPLDKIDLKDIESLIQNAVTEGKSIEYKLSLPDNSDKGKKEFLADVSSFANTSGGDLIFGIREESGYSKEIIGVDISDEDETKQKFENLIRDGLEPRIQASIHILTALENKTKILIIRIHQSWTKPHRVILGGHDKFYARNSAGKYPLDTMELRTAFNLSETQTNRIRNFRAERISALMADNTPIPFYAGGKIILHLIPLEAFSPNANIDINRLINASNNLDPKYCWNNSLINFEGILKYGGQRDDKSNAYVQLYRTGIIEYVDGYFLRSDKKEKFIPSIVYEEELLKFLDNFLNVLRALSVNPTIFIFLTLTGVKGFKMGFKMGFSDIMIGATNGNPIDRDTLILPESLIETYDTYPNKILRPMFDLIWNACGFEKSLNFDENDNWVDRR